MDQQNETKINFLVDLYARTRTITSVNGAGGMITQPNGEKEIIMVGGDDVLKDTEIYSITNNQWRYVVHALRVALYLAQLNIFFSFLGLVRTCRGL